MPSRRLPAHAASLALLLCAAAGPAHADSPLTSTDFARYYANVPMVAHARSTRQIDGRLQRWLLSKRGRLDQRLAAINGLGTLHRGDVQALAQAMAARHNSSWTQLSVKQLSGREALLLGYALARCDTSLGRLQPGGSAGGLASATPLALIAHARSRLRRSFSAHLIAALVEGQKKMSTSFCAVYMGAHRVLRRFGKRRRDMRRRAAAKILGYMRLYRDDCPQFRPKRDPRLDQIYNIVRYKRFIVTGTQGGVVVWDTKRRRPHATHKTFIAARLLVVGNTLWIGAHHEVLRYDGKRFRSYLKAPRARGHVLYLDDQGRLCARRGRRAWAFDGRRFRPTRVRARGYHTLVRTMKGGTKQVWTIDFMRKLRRLSPNPRDYPTKGPLYPGRDPRRFYQDPRGRLWVVDFDDGFFRYDDGADRFRLVQRIGHGSDMAVDAKRGRSWFVDYRRGLLLDDRKGGRNIALPKLQYIRRIYLDPDGSGTLWVGGWTQLLRLELKNGALGRQAFSVAGPRGSARGSRSKRR